MAPLEPWEKVYINLGRNFQNPGEIDQHMEKLTCTECHSGSSEFPNNMEKAHAGFIPDPSEIDANGNNACIDCHEQAVNNFKNSLHQMRPLA